MIESFSTPKRYSKLQAQQEINDGLEEWLQTPISKEGGYHPELTEQFEVEIAEKPLTRKDIENEAAIFIEKYFDELLPLLFTGDQILYPENHDAIIRSLQLTNKEIATLGGEYFIHEKDGKKIIYKTDQYNPDGYPTSEITTLDLLALAWAKENIRIDTRRDVQGSNKTPPHRYFLRSQNRYLCVNDFGMRAWNNQTNTMLEPDVRNIAPFVRTMKHQFVRISENLSILYNKYAESIDQAEQNARRAFLESHGLAEGETIEESEQCGITYDQVYEVQQQARTQAINAVQEKIATELRQNNRDRELLLTGVSFNRVMRQLHFKYETIAKNMV